MSLVYQDVIEIYTNVVRRKQIKLLPLEPRCKNRWNKILFLLLLLQLQLHSVRLFPPDFKSVCNAAVSTY